jgi:hypothetical protein
VTGPVQVRMMERMRVMEVLFGLGMLAAAVFVLAVMLKFGFWLLFAVVLPLAWLWMLIDAVSRTDAEYPSQGSTEKIVWLVLMIFLQPSAIAYYLLVYRKQKRGEAMEPVVG